MGNGEITFVLQLQVVYMHQGQRFVYVVYSLPFPLLQRSSDDLVITYWGSNRRRQELRYPAEMHPSVFVRRIEDNGSLLS